jgi:alkane 1-monooxygenase
MHPAIYATTLSLLVGSWAALLLGGIWTIALPLFIFGAVPLAELLLSGSTDNLSLDAEPTTKQRRIYDWMLYAVVPGQVGLVVLLMHQISVGALSGLEILGATLTVGVNCAAFGINVAHELGHHRSRFDQAMSKILLTTSLYSHFFVEHNRGHHARVATPEDPASAQRGVIVYAFWWRSVTEGYRSAWAIEDHRLRKLAHPRLTWRNEMVRLTTMQLGTLLLAAGVFGPAVLAWMAAGVLGFLLLETVNYLEHYGLSREKKPNGRYERTRPEHSWNSNHPIGRALLFDLTRHSDHHANPGRKYSVLRHFDDSPQLPTGYPGMILLALIPPLWFTVMHPHIDREMARVRSAA